MLKSFFAPPPPATLVYTASLIAGFYLLVTLLHVVIPGPRVEGYVCDWRGKVLSYKLNGFPLLLCVLGAFYYAAPEIATFAVVNWWACVAAANAIGLFCALLLLRLPLEPSFRCLTVDQVALCKRAAKGEDVSGDVAPAPTRNAAAHYFFGHSFNPRLLGVDLKMLLYALGAAALAWNLCSGLALRLSTHGELSSALMLYAVCSSRQ